MSREDLRSRSATGPQLNSYCGAMEAHRSGARALEALAGTRFADVRWVTDTGSTNADALALARDGQPEGIVCVADHQTAGRGRHGRVWAAPAGASLLCTVLLRPSASVSSSVTMGAAVAMAEAVEQVAGFAPRLKWPNDLVWPGDGSTDDRKLAGILAEVDWPAGSRTAGGRAELRPDEPVVVVVGLGVNVNWPDALSDDLVGLAVAADHIAGRPVDREALLIAFLQRLDLHYSCLIARKDRVPLQDAWRQRSATLGRRVRVDLGSDVVEGTAVDITEDGHLIVDSDAGERRVLTVGDVVHLRPALDPPRAQDRDAGSSRSS